MNKNLEQGLLSQSEEEVKKYVFLFFLVFLLWQFYAVLISIP